MSKKLTFKIWLWLIVLVLSLLSIFSFQGLFQHGVMVTSVEQNSTAFDSGLRQGQIINSINGLAIRSANDYAAAIANYPLSAAAKLTIQTKDSEI